VVAALVLVGLSWLVVTATGVDPQMLGYALATQLILGLPCLSSWLRRVEQPWAPLFRRWEVLVLAIASVGCTALAILGRSERVDVQSYDAAEAEAEDEDETRPPGGWIQ
jgi:hypothetical protein